MKKLPALDIKKSELELIQISLRDGYNIYLHQTKNILVIRSNLPANPLFGKFQKQSYRILEFTNRDNRQMINYHCSGKFIIDPSLMEEGAKKATWLNSTFRDPIINEIGYLVIFASFTFSLLLNSLRLDSKLIIKTFLLSAFCYLFCYSFERYFYQFYSTAEEIIINLDSEDFTKSINKVASNVNYVSCIYVKYYNSYWEVENKSAQDFLNYLGLTIYVLRSYVNDQYNYQECQEHRELVFYLNSKVREKKVRVFELDSDTSIAIETRYTPSKEFKYLFSKDNFQQRLFNTLQVDSNSSLDNNSFKDISFVFSSSDIHQDDIAQNNREITFFY